MPAIQSAPPEPGTYRYVLQRYDKAPTQSIRFVGYDEVAQARAIELDGRVAQTLFLRSRNTYLRARKLGWRDVTARWFAHLAGEAQAEAPKPPEHAERGELGNMGAAAPTTEAPSTPEPDPLSEGVAGLALGALTEAGKALTARQLAALADVDRRKLTPALRELMAAGRVVKAGKGATAKYRIAS